MVFPRFPTTVVSENLHTDNLDISWLNEYSSINNINKNYCREPMEKIDVHFVYINEHSYIEKIIKETHDILLADSLSPTPNDVSSLQYVIPKERVLHMILSKQISTPYSKYKLIDTLVYNVDLEPEHIQTFSQKSTDNKNNHGNFLQVLPLIDDIVISPSIFIFHSLNSVFFIFQEFVHDLDHLFDKSNESSTTPSAMLRNASQLAQSAHQGVQSLQTPSILRSNISGSLQTNDSQLIRLSSPEISKLKPILKQMNTDTEHVAFVNLTNKPKQTKKVRIFIPDKKKIQIHSSTQKSLQSLRVISP